MFCLFGVHLKLSQSLSPVSTSPWLSGLPRLKRSYRRTLRGPTQETEKRPHRRR